MAIPAQRQQNILNYLNDNYSITIQQAADLNHVSIATTRRDLDELGRAGLLRRTHGGAVLDDPDSISSEIIHNDKMKLMVSEKIRIAQKAAQMIADGSCIFLDSGTTTLFLAKQLKDRKNLTLITNNLDIACNILLDASSTLVVTGGTRRQDYNVLMGAPAEEFVAGIRVDAVFFGADAIDPRNGLYNSSFSEIGIKRAMLTCADRRILLADHTKFGRRAIAKICDLEEFDLIITDEGLDPSAEAALEKKNIRLCKV